MQDVAKPLNSEVRHLRVLLKERCNVSQTFSDKTSCRNKNKSRLNEFTLSFRFLTSSRRPALWNTCVPDFNESDKCVKGGGSLLKLTLDEC